MAVRAETGAQERHALNAVDADQPSPRKEIPDLVEVTVHAAGQRVVRRAGGDDQDVASIVTATKTLTMTAAIPDGTAVGDWVSLAGDSPIPQIPYEVHNILAQRGAIKVLESLGDASGLQAAADVYTDMVDKFKITVTPRADDSPKRLVSSSPLFGDNGRSSGWW